MPAGSLLPLPICLQFEVRQLGKGSAALNRNLSTPRPLPLCSGNWAGAVPFPPGKPVLSMPTGFQKPHLEELCLQRALSKSLLQILQETESNVTQSHPAGRVLG